MSVISANRYHDISCGHRVFGHEGKCANLHGHNYRVHFKVQAEELDGIGRVIDFGVIKSKLAMWLEDNWDHKFLLWNRDPALETLGSIDPTIVAVPFNPTAENLGEYIVKVIGPRQLAGSGAELVEVTIEETAKCSATVRKG